jgi:hypothetical protein
VYGSTFRLLSIHWLSIGWRKLITALVYSFWHFRCGKAFLKTYLQSARATPLDFLPTGGLLSAQPEADLFAKLCSYKLTDIEEERKFIDHCLAIALETPPEPEFLTSDRYSAVFRRHDVSVLRTRFVDELQATLDKRIRDTWSDATSEDDVWKLESLKESIKVIQADTRYSNDATFDLKLRQLNDYISQLSEDDDENKDGEEDDELDVSTKPVVAVEPERSIFDDIDA